MAEQGRSGSSRRGAHGRARRALAAGDVAELRDALRELVDPLGVMMLTRDRIEDALDDAVSRGRVTADDAQELVSSIVERGRRETNELLGNLESLLAGKADRARQATGLGASLPISGYDDLTAAKVQERLDGLSAAELRRVREHERRNANRKTVLAAIDKRLS